MTESSASDAAYSLRDKERRIYFNTLITVYFIYFNIYLVALTQ